MKTIATIAASVVLSLGVLVTPANADATTPGPWDEATECERTIEGLEMNVGKAEGRVEMAMVTVRDLAAQNAALTQEVAQADKTIARLETRVDRKDARIELLKKKLARARR